MDTRGDELRNFDALRHPNYFHIRESSDRGFIFDRLGDHGPYLYNGLWRDGLLEDIQALLEEFDLADEVFVKPTSDEG
jgi:hypothetical protein